MRLMCECAECKAWEASLREPHYPLPAIIYDIETLHHDSGEVYGLTLGEVLHTLGPYVIHSRLVLVWWKGQGNEALSIPRR